MKLFSRWFAGATAALLASLASQAGGASPAIVITNVPAYGTQGSLGGYVTNANPATNCVAVFIYVAGAWYTKPGCASPPTAIQPDGSWTAEITPNAADINATEIAAFLVPTNYDLACVNGAAGLPIPTVAEAVVYADRVNPTARRFNWSGYAWHVRGVGVTGPGPNHYSNSTNNVWVDAQGLLHLAILYTNGAWQCVQIMTDRSFGYGQYRFTVASPIDSLDPSAVVGLFTWSDDTAYNDREIDIELSHWNYQFGSNNVEDYAVAPYDPGQVLRFAVPDSVTNSTHSFIWQPTNIAFQSLNGDFAPSPAASNILQRWACTNGIPPAGGEQVLINLWLNKGNAPVNGQPVEVILSHFEFVPLGPPPPAKLSQVNPLPGGNVQLAAQGQADRHYQMFSSSNLLDWLEIGAILATNSAITYTSAPVRFLFTDTNALPPAVRFYRALTDP